MYCTKCGEYIADNAIFCPRCGQKVGRDSQYAGNILHEFKQQEDYPHIDIDVETGIKQKSRLVAALLALFFGSLGAHDFYLGNTKNGIIKLVLSILSLGFISGIWSFIEAIYLFTGRITTDANGNFLRDGF